MDKKLKYKEIKNIVHIPYKIKNKDIHLIKVKNYYEDGTEKNDLIHVLDFKRSYYVTKEYYRNYKQTKEFLELNKLDKKTTTQTDLLKSISRTFNKPVNNLRNFKDNKYIFGASICSTSIIKNLYLEKYKDSILKFDVAQLDIEANPVTNEILIASLSFKDEIYTFINKDFLNIKNDNDILNYKDKLNKLFKELIPCDKTIKDTKTFIEIVDSEWNIIKNLFDKAHELKPDIISIWNLPYDIGTILERTKYLNKNPKELFVDPKYRTLIDYYKYQEGRKYLVTAEGDRKSIDIHLRWNYVECAASFFILDALSVYGRLRMQESKVVGGYGLDNILKINGLGGKLKLDNDEKLEGIEWHLYMQSKKPLEYIIYNMWDVLSMRNLERKTKDISNTLPVLCNVTNLKYFDKQTVTITDTLYFHYLKNNKVIGNCPNEFTKEETTSLGLRDWIVTLPIDNTVNNGLKIIKENPNHVTNIRSFVADYDVTSSYPTAICVGNVSKTTTKSLLVKGLNIVPKTYLDNNKNISYKSMFKEINRNLLIEQNMNILHNEYNSIEWCVSLCKFPTIKEIEDRFKETFKDKILT